MQLTPPSSSVAASSPNSLGSGDMDESDSDRDDDPPPRDTGVLYPLEGQFVDQKDKQRIMAMSQLEREEILGARVEEVSRMNFQAELQKRAAMNNKKRKADSEEPEDSRKSSRQVKPKRNAALDAYTLAREQKGQQRQRDDDRRRDRDRSGSPGDGGSDVDAEGEEDVDWDNDRKSPERQDLPVTLRDVESVRIGRGFFSKVCFWPGFEEAMNGAFGRVGVGQQRGQTVYKMAQIKGMFCLCTTGLNAILTRHQASRRANRTCSKEKTDKRSQQINMSSASMALCRRSTSSNIFPTNASPTPTSTPTDKPSRRQAPKYLHSPM